MCFVVGPSGESIGSVQDSRFVFDRQIVFHDPVECVTCAIAKFVWVSIIGEIGVVSMDYDRISQQEVSPIL